MGIPLYMRIQQFIRSKIEQGDWPVGSMIPTETELSQQFGCSRITVTTAVRELVRDGLVYRIQGKGTFVAKRTPESNVLQQGELTRTVYSLEALSIPGKHICLHMGEEIPCQEIASILQLKPGLLVIHVDRIKYIDNKPSFVERAYLSHVLFSSASKLQLAEDPIAKLAETCGVFLGKNYISSEPIICSEDLADLLEIPAGSAILQFCIEIHDIQERPIACYFIFTSGKQEKTLLE